MLRFEKYENFVIKIGYDGQVYQRKQLSYVIKFQTLFYEITEKSHIL